MAVLKPGSLLVTGTGVSDTAPGIQITFNASHSVAQSAFSISDYFAAPIFVVQDPTVASSILVGGDYLSAFRNPFGSSVKVDGARAPATIVMPDGPTNLGLHINSGTDAPARAITVTNSTSGSPGTLTATAHGLPSTATPVIFTAKSGLSESPSITLNNVDAFGNYRPYYVRQVVDANQLQVYTNSLMTVPVNIGANGGTASFYLLNASVPSAVGDLYIRLDTPSTSNQRLYQCIIAGTPGTWAGRL